MKGSSGQPSSDAVHLGAILVLQLIEESLNFMGLESNATPNNLNPKVLHELAKPPPCFRSNVVIENL